MLLDMHINNTGLVLCGRRPCINNRYWSALCAGKYYLKKSRQKNHICPYTGPVNLVLTLLSL